MIVGPLLVALTGQVSPQSGGYLLRAKYRPGTVLRYMIESDVEGAGKVQIPQTLGVGEVAKGIAKIQITVGNATLNGQILAQGQSFPAKMTTQNEPVGGAFPSTVTVAYPSKPVKIGGSWTTKVPFAPFALMGVGGAQGEARTKFTLAQVKAGEAKVNLTTAGAISGTGVLRIRTSDGMLTGATFDLKVRFQTPDPVDVNLRVRKL